MDRIFRAALVFVVFWAGPCCCPGVCKARVSSRPEPEPIDTAGELVAKARVVSGQAFRRARGWPQEIGIGRGVSLLAGDGLRVAQEARVQVQFTSGGWLDLIGPALATFFPDGWAIDAGEGMAKGVGPRAVRFGPYRVDPGDNLFTFRTEPEGLMVAALGGIVAVAIEGGPRVHVAPGRRVRLRRGAKALLERVDIRKEALHYESLFKLRALPPQGVGVDPRGRSPTGNESDRSRNPARSEREIRRQERDSKKREAAEGPAHPAGRTGIVGEDGLVQLSLRDRLKGLDSPRSRYFFVKKRLEQEARCERDTTHKELDRDAPDEASSLILFKRDKAARFASQELNDFRHARELSFEERLSLSGSDRDQAVRAERERLFGQPLFLFTARLKPLVEADRARAIEKADLLTLQINILKQTGGSSGAIADLIQKRQQVLTDADRESDALKEQIRLQIEPYR